VKQCKYPHPTTHVRDAELSEDRFRTLRLRRASFPKPYVTDNCIDCLDEAGRKFVARGYRHLGFDPELLKYRDLSVSKVEAAIVYIKVPPPSQAVQVHTLTQEAARTNWKEYEEIRKRFPSTPRRRRIQTRGRSNPQVAENQRRRTDTIRSGIWVRMLKEQGDRCGACKESFVALPHLDHDHRTGKVRALLCGDCNAALGFAHDEPERLVALLEYLNRWKH
jgi:hypothetical protein